VDPPPADVSGRGADGRTPDLGEGVTTYGSFRVSQRGAGANMSVDVNMDDFAYVRGDAVTHQALYKAAPHVSTINETISTADATNPRIDRVILELKDTQHDASGSSLFQTRVVAGTPTGGATLDNLTGAAVIPDSALLLADVLVAASDTSISNAEIRDRRAFIAGIPPVLTGVDMVAFEPPAHMVVPETGVGANGSAHMTSDLQQVAALMRLPRRIVGATRIRWRYLQSPVTAGAFTGTYVIGIYDASGRKVIDTGAVAFTGAADTTQTRSETIAATTLEAGRYYVLFGFDGTGAGTTHIFYPGVVCGIITQSLVSAYAPNMILRAAAGGATAPTTLLAFTDVVADTSSNTRPAVPYIALSVG
jgi:hypothetical protein